MNDDSQRERCWQLHRKAAGEALNITASGFETIARASDVDLVLMEGKTLKAFSLAISAGRALEHIGYQWCTTRFENFIFWDRLVVDVGARRKGIGRDLFTSLLESAVTQQSEWLLCQVHDRPNNKVGHHFVQSLGFKPIESVMLPSRDIVTMYQRSIAIATP